MIGPAWSSRIVRLGLGLCLVAIACSERVGFVQSLNHPRLIGQLDNIVYDNRLRATHDFAEPVANKGAIASPLNSPLASPQYNPTVVIVDIDEASIAQIGRWPWSRTKVAELLERIGEQGPSAIGLDIVFAEPQSDDGQLSLTMDRLPVVLGYYFANDLQAPSVGVLPQPLFSAAELQKSAWSATTWNSYAANVAPLAMHPAGFMNPVVDADGLVRRLPVLAEFKGQMYESFALAVLRKHLRAGAVSVQADQMRLSTSTGTINSTTKVTGKASAVNLPLSEGLTALVPFSKRSGVNGGPEQGRFEYISAAKFLQKNQTNTDGITSLKNKIVLLGTSATGIADFRATPVNRVLPGVETHATLISGALEGSVKQQPANASEMAALAIAVVGILLAGLMATLGPSGILLVGFIAATSITVAVGSVFHSINWWLPSASAYLLLCSLIVVNLLLGYWGEGRSRKAMQSLFGEYVPAHLVDQMSRQPQLYANMRSENKELTILFADIRGFTRIAEAIEPDRLREYINDYLSTMTDIIHRHGGTVDKYIGDAVMAFWGAPVADQLHADNAVTAGLQMLQEAERLSIEFERRGLPPLAIGIGINTGVVRVGDMGSKVRRAYTVLGDAVNLAARYEALTKTFNVPMVLGEQTARKITRTRAVLLSRTLVQGRAEPVEIYIPTEHANLVVNTVAQLSPRDEIQSSRL